MKCLVNYGTSMYSWIMRKALEWCLKKNYAAIRKIFRLYRNVDLKTQDWKWQHTTKTVVLKARIFKVCFKSCNYVFVFCFISLLINYVFWKEHGGKGNERQTMAAAPGVDWPEGSRKGSLQTAPCHTLPTTPLLPWLPPLPPWLPPPPHSSLCRPPSPLVEVSASGGKDWWVGRAVLYSHTPPFGN